MHTYRKYQLAFTLLELLTIVAIVGLTTTIAVPSFANYIENTKINGVILEIKSIEAAIERRLSDSPDLPDSLADVFAQVPVDPWGNEYQYLRIKGGSKKGQGKKRKDHSLVPINSDYDLYSSGPDGQSVAPLTAKHSRDDIVRANNRGFIGKAEDY